MHVIFATYLQNVTILPCKMANNVRPELEQLTNKIHLSRNLVSFLTVEFLLIGA